MEGLLLLNIFEFVLMAPIPFAAVTATAVEAGAR